jgi:hypothetical protein
MSIAASETYPSFRVLVRQVLQSALPRPQKATLQALLAHARADLTVYHAQGQLAWECDYTRPTIRKALTDLEEQRILRVRQGPRQHYATEYAIDLSRLPSRAPYCSPDSDAGPIDGVTSPGQGEIQLPAEVAPLTSQRAIELRAEDAILPAQHETQLPSDGAGGHLVAPRGQIVFPRVVQQEQEKKLFLCHETRGPDSSVVPAENLPDAHTPKLSRPAAKRSFETSAPDTLPITEAIRRWATDAVPGLSLERERDKFLCYARAHRLTNVDWIEALKGWWLEAHARAMRRGDTTPPAVLMPEPQLDSPPCYDDELLAQMKADVARLCGPLEPSIARTSEAEKPCRRHTLSILMAEGAALERDPAYLAQIRARKATLEAQAMWLQTQELRNESAGAAD